MDLSAGEMKEVIAQVDEVCHLCGREIPRGEKMAVNYYDETFCLNECYD